MLKDDESYPFIKITNERYPRLNLSPSGQKDRRTISKFPIRMWAQPMRKSRAIGPVFLFRKCTNPPSQSLFYYHIGQCMAHTICKVKAYFHSMAQEVSDFLKGQDDKSSMTRRKKIAAAAQTMEFERGGIRVTWFRPLEPFRTRAAGHGEDLQNQDVFGNFMWIRSWILFRFSLFVKGSSLKRDVQSLPIYTMIGLRDFLTYVGQFYLEKSHPGSQWGADSWDIVKRNR